MYWKFLYNYNFTPFSLYFTPFFTPFSKNIFKIWSTYFSASGIYMFCRGFLLEIPLNWQFHTFFYNLTSFFHTSFILTCYWKKNYVDSYVRSYKFCLGTYFVTPYIHRKRHLDHNTSSWPKDTRANNFYLPDPSFGWIFRIFVVRAVVCVVISVVRGIHKNRGNIELYRSVLGNL